MPSTIELMFERRKNPTQTKFKPFEIKPYGKSRMPNHTSLTPVRQRSDLKIKSIRRHPDKYFLVYFLLIIYVDSLGLSITFLRINFRPCDLDTDRVWYFSRFNLSVFPRYLLADRYWRVGENTSNQKWRNTVYNDLEFSHTLNRLIEIPIRNCQRSKKKIKIKH